MLKQLQHPTRPRPVNIDGWKRQAKDDRDAAYALKGHRGLLGLPAAQQTSCDNRPICSPVEDQSDLGSCTANMLAALVESNELRAFQAVKSSVRARAAAKAAAGPQVAVSNVVTGANGVTTFTCSVTPPAATPTPAPAPTPPGPTPAKVFIDISRLFQYYATRKIEGTISEDSGASIRNTIKAAAASGVVDEKLWPYDITKFKVNPPQNVWTAAATHKVTSYHAIADGDIETMKATLLQGFLVGFGFDVYDAFLSLEMAKKGLLCPPKPGETLQGGHAVVLVGFDDAKKMPDGSVGAFLVRNSWGTDWGVNGYFWMAYAYVANKALCSDFWVVMSSPV